MHSKREVDQNAAKERYTLSTLSWMDISAVKEKDDEEGGGDEVYPFSINYTKAQKFKTILFRILFAALLAYISIPNMSNWEESDKDS